MEVLQDTYRTINFGPKEYEVPNEWKILKIKETSTLKGRIGWQGLTTKEYLKEGDYFLITGTDFKNGRIDWENCHFVDQDRFDQDAKIQIKKNDILITKDGTIGKVAIIASELSKPGTLNSGVFVLRPTNKDYLPIFMYYYLNSFFFSSFISQIKAGSTIAHLYQKDFEKYTFLVPSIQEQQKIADILSTVDEQISTTVKIIKKSKELKKGLMQKLFSEGIGHTEFKDTKIGRIPKDWDLLSVDKCILKKKFSVGKIPKKEYFKEGSFPIIDQSKTFIIGYSNHSELLYNGNLPAIIYGDHTNHVKYVNQPFICGADGVKIIQPLDELDNKFIYYSILYRKPQSEGYRRHFSILKEKILCIPTFAEQQEIASILSEADAKIEKEQTQKTHLEALKKGLMQQLLTGKKRVKV